MVEEVEQRKAMLKAELRQIEYRLEERLAGGFGLFGEFLPSERIRRTPIRSVTIAVTAGFLAGMSGFRPGRGRSRGLFRSTLTGMVFNELKRIAARKAFHYAMDLADERLRERFGMRKTDGEDTKRT